MYLPSCYFHFFRLTFTPYEVNCNALLSCCPALARVLICCNCILVLLLPFWLATRLSGQNVKTQTQNGKGLPVHPMNPYRGSKSRLIALITLILSTRFRRAVNFTPRPLYPQERVPVPTKQETVLALKPVLPLPRFKPFCLVLLLMMMILLHFVRAQAPEGGDKHFQLQFHILILKMDRAQTKCNNNLLICFPKFYDPLSIMRTTCLVHGDFAE